MANLSSSQVEQFKRDGFLLLYDVVPEDRLQILQSQFEQWKEESRNFSGPYGKTFDNRPRFDVEPGHSAERSALRIASLVEIPAAYLTTLYFRMRNAEKRSKGSSAKAVIRPPETCVRQAISGYCVSRGNFKTRRSGLDRNNLDRLPGLSLRPYRGW